VPTLLRYFFLFSHAGLYSVTRLVTLHALYFPTKPSWTGPTATAFFRASVAPFSTTRLHPHRNPLKLSSEAQTCPLRSLRGRATPGGT
jgi:hypothetical protein